MDNYRLINGVEHYKDVSRRGNPEWLGWQVIDYLKQKYGKFYECQDKCGDLENLYKLLKNKNHE